MSRPHWSSVRAAGLLGLAAVWAFAPPLAAQEKFRKTPPLPETLRELRLPTVESTILSNGLRVSVVPRPASPLVTLQVIVRAGEGDAPPEIPGVAAVTARMIGRGTKLLSGDDVEDAIESIGGSFSVTVAMDYTALTFSVVEENVDAALELLRQILLEPQFSGMELTSVKRTYSYELRELNRNPEWAARRHFLRFLFERHPYETANYPIDAIPRITARDVAAFYGRFYKPNNAIFLVTGRTSLANAARRVSRHLNNWVSYPVRKADPPPPRPNEKERVCFVDHPGSEDVTILVGNVADTASSPGFFPLLVLNQLLGGTTGSRLFMNLRETKSLAYYAFSELATFRSCGAYWARARVPAESAYATVQEIIGELRTLSVERAKPEEIERAKSFLIGNLPARFATVEGFSARLAEAVGLGLSEGQWNTFSDSIMQVNVENVLEAAGRAFSPVPLVVIVADRGLVDKTLRDFRLVEIYDDNGVFKQTLHKGDE